MKDEIKQILDILTFNKEEILNGICNIEDFISREKIIKLLDYITNLQEENENRISESLSYDLAKAKIKELEYKVDKAIEYIDYASCCIHDEELLNELLNILQGKSDE